MVPAVSPKPHGILRPSSAPRWGICAGSFTLEGYFPEDEDGPEAREGTAAHFYVTEYLEGRAWPVGHVTPNGHPIDQAMVTNGQAYIDDVMARLATFRDPRVMFCVEAKVFPHGLIHPDCEGTPDTYALSLAEKRLDLWDYKYGHKYVDPFRNWQLVAYVAGIFEDMELDWADIWDMKISLRVIQPRNYAMAGPVRVWDTTGAILWGLIQELSASAYRAKEPGAMTLTGPQCTHCRGRHACEAFMRVAATSMEIAGETTPVNLTPRALGLELARLVRAEERIKARRDALEVQALALIQKGTDVPYWTKDFVNSKERWSAPLPEVFAMGDMMGVELRKPDAITPNQARKLGIDAAVIAAYSEKPKGAAKLVPSTQSDALKAFG